MLVITGKGVQGDGVLKRRAPEWLAAPHLAHIVAGISDAARHHGGEGALYVALKRKREATALILARLGQRRPSRSPRPRASPLAAFQLRPATSSSDTPAAASTTSQW